MFAGAIAGTAFGQTFGISTFAGQANSPGATNAPSGPATSAQFSNPAGVALHEGSGILYVADSANNKIRKIVISTGAVSDFATGLNGPSGVAVDTAGAVYVADTFNHVIKRYTSAGVLDLTVGASGTSGLNTADSTQAAARFNTPIGIAVNGAGTFIYVADTNNHLIRRIATTDSATAVTTIGGTLTAGAPTPGFEEGTPGTSKYRSPQAVALNAAADTLYVADYNNNAIRRITLSTSTTATLAGTGTAGSTDSSGGTPLFSNPDGVSVDSSGNVYVSDSATHIIRKVTSGGTVTTLAGSAGSFGTTDAVSTSARFRNPFGIATNAAGDALYIADSNNQTIRRAVPAVAPAFTSANNATFTVNVPTTFTVTATGSPAPTYSIISGALPSGLALNATTGVISGTVTSTAGTPIALTLQASNGVGSVATQSFTLNLNQVPVITSANSTSFSVGTAGSFTVTATGTPAPTFIFTGVTAPFLLTNTTTGVISGTPSNTTGSPFTFTVQATNSAGTSPAQTFTLTVVNGASISTQPLPQVLAAGGSATFNVVATGSPTPTSFQWQRQAAGVGEFANLSSSGVYLITSPASGQSTLTVNPVSSGMNGDRFRVVVSNGVGSSVTSTDVGLTVAVPPTITSAAAINFGVGVPNTFTITSTGSPAPTYAVTSGSLPPWATFDTTTGVIAGSPNNTTGSPFNFTITASNGAAPNAVQPFTLTVLPAGATPTFTLQPSSQTVAVGQNAGFSVTATGAPTPTIQWQRQASGTSGFVNLTDDATYSGTTSSTLVVNGVTISMNNDVFRAVATNSAGTVNSTEVSLTLSLGSIFSTLAGQAGVAGGLDGAGLSARFSTPAGVGTDAAGNIYVADSGNHVIRKITPSGTVTVLAGQIGVAGSDNGVGGAARFRGPAGVAVDPNGNVYVADTFNHTIRLITTDGNVTTLSGSPGVAGSADGSAPDARYTYPYGIAIDRFGGVYVADTYNHTIRKIASSTVTTIAGAAGQAGALNSNVGTSARFRFPSSLAVDYLFNIYVADAQNHAIRKITSAGAVSTFAGELGTAGIADGASATARFRQPSGITVDPQFSVNVNVYVADSFNHTIRRINSSGDVTTLAGLAGTPGTADGAGTAARFNAPLGVVVDSSGTIYVADTQNSTIRKSTAGTAPSITTQPTNQTVAVGGTVVFSVVATGSPAPVYQWRRQAANTSGFVDLTNNATYSGVSSNTLTVTNATAEMSGDLFEVLVTNLVNPSATSAAVSLTIAPPPVFTSATSTSFRAGQAGSFTVTATSTPAATFTATGLPSWATLSSAGVLSGTPPDTSGSPFTITLTANNGSGTSTAVNQTFVLTVEPSQVAPSITTQPATVVVNRGENATFSVVATGTATLNYQWRKDGGAINGATSSSFTIPNAQPSDAGTYTVVVSNSFGSATSNTASLVVNAAPTFVAQPTAQTVSTGGTVTFSAGVTGGNLSYQWRKNGVAIPGATSSTFTLAGVTANDAANYDVVVSNGLGSVLSSLAQLNVVTGTSAPSFTLHPANRTVVAGGSLSLTAAASAAPSATYQWRKNGVAINGATGSTLTLTNVQAGDAANYDVVASNSVGSATSQIGTLRVIARSYAGTYFGTAAGAGSFALYVRPDNTGVFLGFVPGSNTTLVQPGLAVNDAGQFSFAQSGVNVSGTLGTDGAVSGSYSGGTNASLNGSRTAAAGTTQNVAGFYTAGASNSATVGYAITSANGQAFAVVQAGSGSDGGFGAVTNAGQVTVATGRSTLAGTINASAGTFTLTSNGAVNASLSGASEAILATQRLANISSRANVGTGSAVAIAGFVISGNESKPVLIRAVGPTLGAAPFSVPGALTTPKLDIHRIDTGNVLVATNSGIGTGAGRAAIDAAGTAAGAFALGSAGTDAAILTTLSPGNYTATVSSTGSATGIALIEVYDLSAPAAGQKLFNISTRANAGTNTNALVAGVVVTGSVSKRVLIRGVGPGLAAFGLTGTLAAPTLTLVNTQGGATVATNTGFNSNNNPDAAAIAAASVSVGAFPLVSGDSALIVSLPPGNYTAQVSNAGGATGLAIIEVYELP